MKTLTRCYIWSVLRIPDKLAMMQRRLNSIYTQTSYHLLPKLSNGQMSNLMEELLCLCDVLRICTGQPTLISCILHRCPTKKLLTKHLLNLYQGFSCSLCEIRIKSDADSLFPFFFFLTAILKISRLGVHGASQTNVTTLTSV